MRVQIITTLKRLGHRSGHLVDVLCNDLPVKWYPYDKGVDAIPDTVFQIGDGVGKHQVMKLLECQAGKKYFLIMGMTQDFLDKTVRDQAQYYKFGNFAVGIIQITEEPSFCHASCDTGRLHSLF